MWIGPLIALALAHPVPFRTVAAGSGEASAYRTPSTLVVKDARRWKAVWGKLEPGRKLPKADFARHMLLVVTQGERRSGGYSIDVTKIGDSGRALSVAADSNAPGAGCITPSVITAPYEVVRVRRLDRAARTHRTAKVTDCDHQAP
ncbi:MAG TPA: protease complex subunit PrcB family protein [Solirubrobacter sp.]|nr:protease complex subunit PrcB family protein [Solirubrobacter sp.]